MKHLMGLTSLEALSLDNTDVGDRGIRSLSGLTRLWQFSAENTNVTACRVEQHQIGRPFRTSQAQRGPAVRPAQGRRPWEGSRNKSLQAQRADNSTNRQFDDGNYRPVGPAQSTCRSLPRPVGPGWMNDWARWGRQTPWIASGSTVPRARWVPPQAPSGWPDSAIDRQNYQRARGQRLDESSPWFLCSSHSFRNSSRLGGARVGTSTSANSSTGMTCKAQCNFQPSTSFQSPSPRGRFQPWCAKRIEPPAW